MEELTSGFQAARWVSTPLVAIRTADPASTTHFIIETLRQELAQGVLILDELLPSTSHLEQIVRETFNAAKPDEPEHPVIVKAADALIGLAPFPAEQALAISLVKRQLDTEDLWERKRQIIEQPPRPSAIGTTGWP